PTASQATLLDDLNGLLAQSQALDTQLKDITLTGDTVCGPLVAANQAARDLVNNITQIDQRLAGQGDILELGVKGLGLGQQSIQIIKQSGL
ncbi:MAG: hypothetical protein KJ985_04200, partial [Proteobacteria bacterium]|nr:hypothetical protein [Pseudomonadota bacterium]